MRTIGFWSILLCVGVGVGLVFWAPGMHVGAQRTAAEYKIGVVDIDVVVQGYERRKAEVETMAASFDARQQAVQEEMRALEERRDALREQGEVGTSGERFELTLGLEDEFFALTQRLARLRADEGHANQRLQLVLRRDIQAAIDAVGSEGNYHLLFQRSNDGANDLIFVSPTVNVTSRLIDRLNREYRASQQ